MGFNQKLLKLSELTLSQSPHLSEELTIEAINQVGHFYSGTKNRRIARIFARLVEKESLSPDVRTLAYTSFLDVIDELGRFPKTGFIFQQDTDWHLVKQYTTRMGNLRLILRTIFFRRWKQID